MSSSENIENSRNFLLYTDDTGHINVAVLVEDDTVWTSQRNMANIFGVNVATVNEHVQNIYASGELERGATIRKSLIVQTEGSREVKRELDFYNLDIIIAVGYRINSYNATRFRIWSTKVLREYLQKGFVLDDERLKQGQTLFGKDYFDELLERIREIRASERRFYEKITDIYAQCSIDYDSNSATTHLFYATVQNKLEYAITHKTAAEIIRARADCRKPNMGLTSWKKAAIGGKIVMSDVKIAKNYLEKEEMSELNKVVTMYLDYAELQAERKKAMKMADWVEKLNAFLQFNEYEILQNAGKIKKEIAFAFAESEYIKFRPIQDKNFVSDFDIMVKETKKKKSLEAPKKKNALSPLNKALDQALKFNPKDFGDNKSNDAFI